MADQPKLHDHLEVHALVDGGYVVREGRFDMGIQNGDQADRAMWTWRQERAAFATLDDALKWMAKKMVRKSPETK